MKFKKIVIWAIVATLVVVSMGCTDTGKYSAKDIAKMMPETIDEGLATINLKAIREEQNLKSVYDEIKEDSDDFILRFEDIDYIGVGYSYGDFIILLNGQFDEDDIKNVVKGCDDVEYYNDAEIWTSCYDYDTGSTRVILDKDLVMLCDSEGERVKRYVDTVRGREKSVYDADEDLRDIVNKLPDGIITFIMRIDYYDAIMGFTVQKYDEETLETKIILKFQTEEDAAEYGEEFMEDLDTENIFDIKTRQNGEFVEITGKLLMRDLSDFMDTML